MFRPPGLRGVIILPSLGSDSGQLIALWKQASRNGTSCPPSAGGPGRWDTVPLPWRPSPQTQGLQGLLTDCGIGSGGCRPRCGPPPQQPRGAQRNGSLVPTVAQKRHGEEPGAPGLRRSCSSRGGLPTAALPTWQPGLRSCLFLVHISQIRQKRRVTTNANCCWASAGRTVGAGRRARGDPRDLTRPRRIRVSAKRSRRRSEKPLPAGPLPPLPPPGRRRDNARPLFRPGLGRGSRIRARAFRPRPPPPRAADRAQVVFRWEGRLALLCNNRARRLGRPAPPTAAHSSPAWPAPPQVTCWLCGGPETCPETPSYFESQEASGKDSPGAKSDRGQCQSGAARRSAPRRHCSRKLSFSPRNHEGTRPRSAPWLRP
nr:uncharacterized protein LOC103348378 [Oryctolagus cuniculus]